MNSSAISDFFANMTTKHKALYLILGILLVAALWYRFLYTPGTPPPPPINTSASIFANITAESCPAATAQLNSFISANPSGLASLSPAVHKTYYNDYLVFQKSCPTTANTFLSSSQFTSWANK